MCVKAAGEDAGGLVAAVLGMLGLEEKDVGETETLESLGMDSMQVAEIRARLQRALGRPIPLEEARPWAFGVFADMHSASHVMSNDVVP